MERRARPRLPVLLTCLTAVALVSLLFPRAGVSASSIWPPAATPALPADPDTGAVELGIKFWADTDGHVTGVRFYKASTNSGTHVGNVWTSTGTLLARATFTNETASGWQQVNFATPVPISANTVYVASYHTTTGHYSCDEGYFAGSGVDTAPLHALADGASGNNGVYAYGSTSRFPSEGWHGSNYWVDLVFSSAGVPPDTTPPSVTAFTLPETTTTLTVPITSFAATDDVGVTGYLVDESSTPPSPTAAGWSAAPPPSYAFATAGTKTLHAWAKDAAGNVSAPKSAQVTIAPSDTTPPAVTAFVLAETATTLTVPITSFTASDNVGVTGYLATESSTTPLPAAEGWSATPPTSYTFATAGTKTLYAWAKDAAGNVSARSSDSVAITLPEMGPEPAGWYAGDMHVHRSCGGPPEALSSLYGKMDTHDLAVISLLADMGNGEVQDPAVDLPRVTGQDDPISTPGRIVHWDAEWHWDPIYWQYPYQALGGHVLALGVTEAYRIWEEYTYPILEWAHQRSGIAGYAHMHGEGIPQSLNCCIPLEYPVEVALGTADFISEDVSGNEDFIRAYYRLLNSGFRPGFAAGTDYPCNGAAPLGSLLTYAQVEGGVLTYRKWVEGIARGRTVVSRNGHNEFLELKVNGTATPGDEIQSPAGASVPVTIQWTAKEPLSGTIQLVHNGVVVASTQASAAPGTPATLSATVEFAKSGWLAARRMEGSWHVLHTAAVFVTVDGQPVRASAADANFHVQWIDNLLEKTSPGGEWSGYFVTSRDEAQARYLAARAIYQQIAAEAGGGEPTPEGTIFTTQTPALYENDAAAELGTRFWADVNGQVSAVRLYTNALEGGEHVVRLWRVSDAALVAGPYTWTISPGTEGWKTFPLPAPADIAANTEYVVAVSTGSDLWYAEHLHGFDAPIVNAHLHADVGSGVWTYIRGTMPTGTWENTNYFRDVLFVPQQ